MPNLRQLLSTAPPPAYYRNVAICDSVPPAFIIGDDGERLQVLSKVLVLMVPLVEYGPEPDYADGAIRERILALLEATLLDREIPVVDPGGIRAELGKQIEPLPITALLCGPDVIDAVKPLGLPVIEAGFEGRPRTIIGVAAPEHLGHDFEIERKHGLVVFGPRVAAVTLA